MIHVNVPKDEFDRAFAEALLKIEKSIKEQIELGSLKLSGNIDPFRTVNYYVIELKHRLEQG